MGQGGEETGWEALEVHPDGTERRLSAAIFALGTQESGTAPEGDLCVVARDHDFGKTVLPSRTSVNGHTE